jgi:hypothetical protein
MSSVIEVIARNIGDTTEVIGGRDYQIPRARIVPNTHQDSNDGEKAIYISQGKGKDSSGVSLSVETLETILLWAKSRE